MKVTYEPGDHAVVEDNVEAGELAACDVTLIRKEGTRWYCENDSFSWGPRGNAYVEEHWLRPN